VPTMKWNNLIAQDRVKELLGHAFDSGTLGHAYLFCGERGVGKFAAAVDLAMAVLCQCKDAAKARPCGECPSCRRAAAYSHPDLHVIMPLCLSAEHKGGEGGGALSEEGWALAAASVRARIDDPYKLPRYDGIPHIPVEWVREADHAVMRGAVEGAAGVAIIDGVETMKKESANAILKTLEEPPPGTLLLLLTERVHGVLPTILSRCQMVRFPLLPPPVVGAELCKRFNAGGGVDKFSGDSLFGDSDAGVDAALPEGIAAAAAAGSLGLAISEYENPLDEYYGHAASLWNDCLRGDWGAAAAAVDGLSSGKDSYTVCRNTVSCLIRLIRAAFLKKFGQGGASMNYINPDMPGGVSVSASLNDRVELPAVCGPDELSAVVRPAQGALSGLDAHGNVLIVMAGLVCSLMEALNVEKQ
jgi:DNA polymerase III delta' subunit